jgi:mRNA deadenylase 3'-5' endonuclease subunit Ccr4
MKSFNNTKEITDTTITSNVHNVRIITFNLLSQDYTSSLFFPKVKKNHINFTPRSEKMKKLLMSWMKVNFIICIQELSIQWYTALADLFTNNNYGIEMVTYIKDKMGVAIAYPKNHYDMLIKDEFVIGSYINDVYNLLNKIKTDIDSNVHINTLLTEISEAAGMQTPILSVLLNCKSYGKSVNKNLLVSTYHMPCRYTKKYFISANINAIKNHLQHLKEKWCSIHYDTPISVVLTGDFNITPKNAEYKLLTGELYTENEIMNRTSEHGESLDFFLLLTEQYELIGQQLMSGIKTRSVHKTHYGNEPKYTNVSLKTDSTFVECIDYILIDDSIDIRSCTVGLTVDEPEKTPYPNGLCPSDHLPLSASLFIL